MENSHSEASMKGDNKEWIVAGRYIKIKVFLSLCTWIVAFMFALSVPARSQVEGNALSYLGLIQDASKPEGFFLVFLLVIIICILIIYFIFHNEEGAAHKFFKILIGLGVVILASALMLFYLSGLKIEANPDNVTPINATSSYLEFIQSSSFSLVLSLGSLFVISMIILCFYYIRKDIVQTIVLPFETNSEDLNGRVISDMIIAELRRIKEIHDSNEREGLKVAKSERLPVPREDSSEVVLSIDLERLGEELGGVSSAMPDVGTFTLSAISIPIAPLVLTINRLRRPKPGIGRIIHGSVQKYGSLVHIEVHIRIISKQNKEETLICEAERNLKDNDISDLMKDLAYNIAFVLYGKRDKKEYEYVFSWTKIPGTDDNRLKKFLRRRYNNDWVCNAGLRFLKSGDLKTINISKESTTLSLTLTNEESEVILKINNNRTDKFRVKRENNELNIYEYRNGGGTAGLHREDAEENLRKCGICYQREENKANDLKRQIDICQEKCIEKDGSPAILGNRHNWLLDVNDIANSKDVICTILNEEVIRKFIDTHDELKNRFGDLNKCKNGSATFEEDELNGYLVYLLNLIIKNFPLDSKIKNYISQNRYNKLRPETRDLYTSKYFKDDPHSNNRGQCFLLNRLLLEDLLCIKLKQSAAEVKTWEDLKHITEAIYFYNLYMNSKDRKYLNQAYNYCAKSSQTNSKIFFSMFYNIAIAYFELGRYNEAEKMFQNAAKIRPIASAHSGRGICLRYLLRFREAMNEFENAICHENTLASLTPLEAARLKINRQTASPGCEEKHACFDKYSLSTSWDLFGGIYLDLGCYAPDLYNRAITGFYEAIKRDPIFPYAWLWLGIVYYRKSAISYRKAERASGNPKSFLYHINKAREDIELALCLVKKAVELGQTYGYKSFSTSPVGLAACLRLSSKICDLWNQEKSGIKHISDDDYRKFYSEVEEDLNNIEKFCGVGKGDKIIERNNSSCNDKNRQAYKEAYEVLLRNSIDDEYNRACQESLRGRRSEALDHLKSALDTKRISRVQALFDPDLYLFLPELEDFLKNRSDDVKVIEEIRYILSKEKDKYIRASFEAAARNKKGAVKLLLEKREELRREAEEALKDDLQNLDQKLIKKLKEESEENKLKELENKFNLDPNFYSLQNIAIVSDVSPKSPAPGSKIMVNIEIINTFHEDLKDLHIEIVFPKNIEDMSGNKDGKSSKRRVSAKPVPLLESWARHHIQRSASIDYWTKRDNELIVIARGDTFQKHAFYWDDIRKGVYAELMEFLRQKFDFSRGGLNIDMDPDNKSIKISAEERSLSLKLYANETRVFLKTDDDRTCKLKAEKKDGRINVYEYHDISNIDRLNIKVNYS